MRQRGAAFLGERILRLQRGYDVSKGMLLGVSKWGCGTSKDTYPTKGYDPVQRWVEFMKDFGTRKRFSASPGMW